MYCSHGISDTTAAREVSLAGGSLQNSSAIHYLYAVSIRARFRRSRGGNQIYRRPVGKSLAGAAEIIYRPFICQSDRRNQAIAASRREEIILRRACRNIRQAVTASEGRAVA